MVKKKLIVSVVGVLLLFAACGKSELEEKVKIEAGTYKGIYWKGASKGTTLEEAEQKIETILTLDENAIIKGAKIDFLVLKNGEWIARNNSEAKVVIDFNIDPKAAKPGKEYKKGISMFDIKSNDMMSFYATGVDSKGTVAIAIVDAVTRYQLEMKLDPGYDYDTKMEQLTINSRLIPTVRTSESGLLKPQNWNELEGKNLFTINMWNHVMTENGVLEGLDENSTVKDFLISLGIDFENGKPLEMKAIHGFHSMGGWKGNYEAIEKYLIGKDARELTSLVDWSIPKFEKGINEDNSFGIDTPAGATRTAQNSLEGIAGATVRLSRESASYQVALLEAGIISEDEIIKGRF